MLPFALAIAASAGPACGAISGVGDFTFGETTVDAAPGDTAHDVAAPVDPPKKDASVDADVSPMPDAATRTFASCKELRASGITTDGIHTIDPDDSGLLPAVDVYCEMTTDGGGWTLVARSVDNGSGPFGWLVRAGVVTNDAAIYSLGEAALAIPFTEVLLAARDGSAKALGTIAYKLQVSSAALASAQTMALSGYAISTVRGTCSPSGGPSMLTNMGFTASATQYFFRDIPYDDAYGLQPGGFTLTWPNCNAGGNLLGVQGMVFVR